MSGMIAHGPPQDEKKGRMLPPEGARVKGDVGLFHLGGDRFITAKIYPEHQVGAWIVNAHGRWSKHPIARFETKEEAEVFVAAREKEDQATRERVA